MGTVKLHMMNISEETVKETELSGRVREARERKGFTQEELAEKVGVSRRSIGKYEAGESQPRGRTLRKIAQETGVDYDWLRSGERHNPPTESESPQQTQEERKLPILDLNAQAGNGGYTVDESPIGYMTPDQQSPFYEVRRGSRSVYYIPVRGNSMYPTLKRGELVPVRRFEPSVSTIKEDDIYVFRWDSHTYIKRLQKLAKHRLKVISDNEAYDAQYIELDEGVDFEVLGQVLV